MKVKGTAVISIGQFVKQLFPARYDEWFCSLPDPAKEIFQSAVYANNWYPMDEAAIIPTQKISELFFNDIKEGAWMSGRYSAEAALKGIYKAFVKVSSPIFMIKRASKMLPTYYQPSELKIISNTKKGYKMHITEFEIPSEIIEYRIAGWMEKALEMTKCRNLKIKITKSLTRGDDVTEYIVSWD